MAPQIDPPAGQSPDRFSRSPILHITRDGATNATLVTRKQNPAIESDQVPLAQRSITRDASQAVIRDPFRLHRAKATLADRNGEPEFAHPLDERTEQFPFAAARPKGSRSGDESSLSNGHRCPNAKDLVFGLYHPHRSYQWTGIDEISELAE
jgi:hypothetical protein